MFSPVVMMMFAALQLLISAAVGQIVSRQRPHCLILFKQWNQGITSLCMVQWAGAAWADAAASNAPLRLCAWTVCNRCWTAGEKFWRLPLNKCLKKQLESPIADMKNYAGEAQLQTRSSEVSSGNCITKAHCLSGKCLQWSSASIAMLQCNYMHAIHPRQVRNQICTWCFVQTHMWHSLWR